MEIRTYSRKQAGVIYRAIKEGKIEMDKESVSFMYDFATDAIINSKCQEKAAICIASIKAAVEHIFNGDYESAQICINNFCAVD